MRNSRTPERAWSLLAELKAPQAASIGEMLKRDYPDSSYARQVFF